MSSTPNPVAGAKAQAGAEAGAGPSAAAAPSAEVSALPLPVVRRESLRPGSGRPRLWTILRRLRSLALGLVLGIIATIGIAAAANNTIQVGRYQVSGAPNGGMLVDTATGQVWMTHHDGFLKRKDRSAE